MVNTVQSPCDGVIGTCEHAPVVLRPMTNPQAIVARVCFITSSPDNRGLSPRRAIPDVRQLTKLPRKAAFTKSKFHVELCSSIRPYRKRHHMQPGVGHYGGFSGRKWEAQIYPLLKNVILSSD